MTEEELRKENAELKSELTKKADTNHSLVEQMADLESKNAELKSQIEKMKCCGNCKYSNQEGAYSIVCKVGGVDKSDYINVDDNQVCDKWELRR